MSGINITDAETFNLLRETADNPALGDDFILQIDFKPAPASMPSRFATFSHVNFEQITMPEPWLQQLSNSARGVFVILVKHANKPHVTLGGALTINFANGLAPEAKFDWAAFDSPDYRGPKDLIYPSRPNAAPAPVASAAPTTNRLPSSVGELVPLLQKMIERPTGPDPFARFMEMQQEDRRRDEARRSEERERAEKREEREANRLREEKKEEREREEKREEREREYRREQVAAAAKSNEMMIQLLTREPPKNPLMEAMIQRSMNSGDEQAAKAGALIGQMGMIMQQSMNMSLQMIHTQAELASQNQPQSPMWDLAGKLVEGYFGMHGLQEEELEEALTEAQKKKLPANAPVAESSDKEVDEDEIEETGEQQPSVENPLQRLDRAIHQEAPLRELADALCMALVTPDFQSLYVAAKGNVQKLIIDRYGEWMKSAEVTDPTEREAVATRRMKYVSSMMLKAYNIARQRGILKAPPAKKDAHAKPQPQAAKKKPTVAAVPTPKPESEPEPKKDPAA
jgi:hypothetical protein